MFGSDTHCWLLGVGNGQPRNPRKSSNSNAVPSPHVYGCIAYGGCMQKYARFGRELRKLTVKRKYARRLEVK